MVKPIHHLSSLFQKEHGKDQKAIIDKIKANADQIIFLEDGKLMEQGNHSKLVDLRGKYSKFCLYQENFVPENA